MNIFSEVIYNASIYSFGYKFSCFRAIFYCRFLWSKFDCLTYGFDLLFISYTAIMQQPKGEMSLHPNVRFQKFAFFDSVTTLLEPSVFVPVPNAQNWQEDSYHFNLSPQQVFDISNNK